MLAGHCQTTDENSTDTIKRHTSHLDIWSLEMTVLQPILRYYTFVASDSSGTKPTLQDVRCFPRLIYYHAIVSHQRSLSPLGRRKCSCFHQSIKAPSDAEAGVRQTRELSSLNDPTSQTTGPSSDNTAEKARGNRNLHT